MFVENLIISKDKNMFNNYLAKKKFRMDPIFFSQFIFTVIF